MTSKTTRWRDGIRTQVAHQGMAPRQKRQVGKRRPQAGRLDEIEATWLEENPRREEGRDLIDLVEYLAADVLELARDQTRRLSRVFEVRAELYASVRSMGRR